jgi:hypothetical protein
MPYSVPSSHLFEEKAVDAVCRLLTQEDLSPTRGIAQESSPPALDLNPIAGKGWIPLSHASTAQVWSVRLHASKIDKLGQNSDLLFAGRGTSSQRRHLSLVPQNRQRVRASA